MNIYKPVHVTSKGLVTDIGETNALGVYQDDALVAIYIHDPAKPERVKSHVLFYLSMAASLALLLLYTNQHPGWQALIAVLVYLGVSWILMWGLLLSNADPVPNAALLKSALYLTHGPTLDIVGSRKRLLKEYPVDTQHP